MGLFSLEPVGDDMMRITSKPDTVRDLIEPV